MASVNITVGQEDDSKASEEIKSRKGSPYWYWWSFLIKLTILVCLSGLLAACMMTLKDSTIWGLEAWRASLLIYILSAGVILAMWVTEALVFLVRCLEFIKVISKGMAHVLVGLRKSGCAFIWVVMVLVAWVVVKVDWVEVRPSTGAIKALFHQDYVTRALVGVLVGALLWMGKTLLMGLLALSFIVHRSEERIEKTKEEQKVLKDICDSVVSSEEDGQSSSSRSTARSNLGQGWRGKKLKLIQEYKAQGTGRGYEWIPKYVLDEVAGIKLPKLGEKDQMEEVEEEDDISIESIVSVVADRLFKMIYEKCNGRGGGTSTSLHNSTISQMYIRKQKPDDVPDQVAQSLLAKLEEVISPVTRLNENEKIKQFRMSDFRRWVVTVHINRLLLLRTFNGRNNALGELNRVVSSMVLVIIVVLWVLIMGLSTIKVLAAIGSLILALNFIFRQSAKTIFEAILFVFVTRPFDVGDIIKVEGWDQMVIVHDMKLLGTVFEVTSGEKLFSSNSMLSVKAVTKAFHPNSALMGKNITNYYYIPDLSDTVEFFIALETPQGIIDQLETRIKNYLNKNSERWDNEKCRFEVEAVLPGHGDSKTKKVVLQVCHKIRAYNDKDKHWHELVSELRKYIRELRISIY